MNPVNTAITTLHEYLKGHKATGLDGSKSIDLYDCFRQIKIKASEWLKGYNKNGYEHSERLEMYLNELTREPRKNGILTPGEAFVLLCAVYMHDLGYMNNGKLDPNDHPKRSQDDITADPKKYHLDDFPSCDGKGAVYAIGRVCYGHSIENDCPLNSLENEFPNSAVSEEKPLNLRKLAALLRLADEADDPYIRPKGKTRPSIRDKTPLVTVEPGKIVWHWKVSGVSDPSIFEIHLEEKNDILKTAIEYLRDTQVGSWDLVLRPPVKTKAPFMAPKSVEYFVGRKKDLQKIHDIIETRQTGAITGVKGTGGMGKTEFVKRYAVEYQMEYPGGVFWASMKGSNWKHEAEKILTALKPLSDPMVFPDEEKAKEEVIKKLKRKDALLIIDNVEETKDIIKPECAILITTRDKGVFGIINKEAIYHLKPFPIEEGLDLFRKILGNPRVNKDLQGATTLVEEVLGGMPLAIEIAAQYLSNSPDTAFPEYIGAIKGKVELLRLEDDPDKNVKASLTLSLDLLQKEKQGEKLLVLFEAGAVCAVSGFTSITLGAAAGLDISEPGKKTFKDLVGKIHHLSLLEYSGETERYTMHTLVRELAEYRLKADAERMEQFQKNHCTYFLNFTRIHENSPHDLIRERDGLWQAMIQTNQIKTEQEKLPFFLKSLSKPYLKHIKAKEYEPAFQYLVASNLINIDELGLSKELVLFLTPLVEKQAGLKDIYLGWILTGLGIAYAYLGEYRKAIELYEKALEIARRIGDVRSERNALGNMGSAYLQIGEYRKAIELYNQALEIDRRIGDVRGEGSDLGNMGLAYDNLGEYHKAIELYEKHLEIARRIGDVQGEGTILGNMGLAYLHLGEYRKAIELYEKALEIARRIGDVQGEGTILGNMGVAYLHIGEYRKAIELYEKHLEIVRRIGDVQGEGNALCNMGLAYAALGEYHKAIELYEKHLEIVRRIEDVQGEGNALGNMGVAYAALGNSKKARESFLYSIAIFKNLGLNFMVEKSKKAARSVGIDVE